MDTQNITLTREEAILHLSETGIHMMDNVIERIRDARMPTTDLANIPDPAVAAAGLQIFAEKCTKPLANILSRNGYKAYELLLRNFQVETQAAVSTMKSRLSTSNDDMHIAIGFGLFAGTLAGVESEMPVNSVLTPTAMLLVEQLARQADSSLFESFEDYIDQESEHSYGPIMSFIPKVLHATDLKFSHVYAANALPVFVQMMRNIPSDELIELDKRYYNWMATHVPHDQYDSFAAIAMSALQIFYNRILEKSDWPK